MKRRSQWMVLCVGLATTVACEDATRPVDDVPTPARTMTPTDADMESMPPEFRLPTSIIRHDVTGGYVSRFAFGQGILEYIATHAKETAWLQLFKGDSPVGGEVAAVERRSDLLPARRQFSAMITVGVPKDCGYRHNVRATGEIHNQFPVNPNSWFQWGDRAESGQNAFAQPPCSCGTYTGENGTAAVSIVPQGPQFTCDEYESDPSSGGGDSGGTWAEVTTTTCHGTHYYDNDGNYLRSEIDYCEQTYSYVFLPAAA